jgi:hypothetical protein
MELLRLVRGAPASWWLGLAVTLIIYATLPFWAAILGG